MSDRIRVLIVDDEPPVVEGLRAVIERELPDFYVVGSASNGREAIESASALQPDVILLDVQMPGIDGIEALRTMRSQGVRAAAILVTAYERFDVARRGYGLGVRDYLVKPVGPKTVRDALEVVRVEIEAERERRAETMQEAETRTQMLRIVEGALLHLVLAGSADSPIVNDILRYLKLDSNSVLPVLLVLDQEEPRLPELVDRLRYTVHGPVGLVEPGIVLALAFDVKDDLSNYGERLRQVAAGGKQTAVDVRIGTSGPLRRALTGIRALTDSAAIVPDASLYQLRASIVRAVQTGDTDVAAQTLDDYLSAAAEYAATVPALEALLVTLSDAVGNHRGAVSDVAVQAILESRRISDPAASTESIRHRISEWIATSAESVSLSQTVRAAAEMMRSEFSSDLSIEIIAERLGVSSSHLSRLFSAELGQPPSAFLSEVRIQHAIQLLTSGEYSIKEVSARCGYRDPNYFSRAFRSATGQSPSEFAQSRRTTSAT